VGVSLMVTETYPHRTEASLSGDRGVALTLA
jgi:hypothetical protein